MDWPFFNVALVELCVDVYKCSRNCNKIYTWIFAHAATFAIIWYALYKYYGHQSKCRSMSRLEGRSHTRLRYSIKRVKQNNVIIILLYAHILSLFLPLPLSHSLLNKHNNFFSCAFAWTDNGPLFATSDSNCKKMMQRKRMSLLNF